jgi:DNA polymerase III subunit chi
MTDVSFYLLQTTGMQDRYRYACKLIEKAYRTGCFCYVLTDSPQQSQTLDDLLWTFRPTSFVPHEIYHGMIPEFANTVLIGHYPAPAQWQKVILNLAAHPPTDLSHTERLLEILDNNESLKQLGRQRYRHYQQLGLSLKTHHVN